MFALTFDIGHFNAIDNIDERFILNHEDRLAHFHIHDGKGKQDHLTLGAGEIDLAQRINLAGKYDCRCVVETKTIEALEKSAGWLREKGFR